VSRLLVGTKVKVKATNLRASLGIDHTIQGGEGVIAAISEDSKGVFYVVKMMHKKSTRSLRKENLVIHREPKKKARKKR
jgi:hypothetical protein